MSVIICHKVHLLSPFHLDIRNGNIWLLSSVGCDRNMADISHFLSHSLCAAAIATTNKDWLLDL